MRIALEMTAAGKPGGVPVYAEQIVRALGRVAEPHRLILWCGSGTSAAAAERIAPPNARVVTPGTVVRYAAKWGQFGRLNPLSVEALVGPVDVFHALNFFLPAHRGHARLVATLHDLSALAHPEWHPRSRALITRLALGRTVHLVDHVITLTEAVRGEVIECLRLPADRVTAVPLAPSRPGGKMNGAVVRAQLERYELKPRGYLCYAGALEPRKNLVRLLEGFALVRSRRPDIPRLVLAGPAGWRNDEIRPRLGDPGVVYLGYLPGDDLASLIAGSLAFLYPSLYEGFGLPVLDALAYGVPVLTSDSGALAEVARGAALIVDPYAVDAIAAGIERLVDDGALRADLARRGLERARDFSWERTASETLAVYERLMAER